jgi:pimeloyl-ACP methyl ester carboxylesterase
MTQAELDPSASAAASRRSVRTEVLTDDGVRLTVETWPADSPAAPVVLALHGITANRLGFLPLVDDLAGAVTLVAFDARGRGRSDKPTDEHRYGHRRHAEDAALVLGTIEAGPVVVVGQSMGAWIGLQLAAHHPDLVHALVLGDGGYFADLPSGTTPMDYVDSVMGAGWLDRMQAVLPSRDSALTILRSVPPFRDMWDDRVAAMLAESLEEQPDGTVRNRCSPVAATYDSLDYFTPADLPYVRRDLANVGCPVHLVRAPRGFDLTPELAAPLLPDSAVEGFQRALPQLTVETVPDTNHYTVNFGARGVAAIAAAVRASLA